MALGDESFVPGPFAPGDGALLAPHVPLGHGLGALALTGSVAIHATFVIGLLALHPADAPGVAGENVIEVSVVSAPPAFDETAFTLPPPEVPAEPFFPAEQPAATAKAEAPAPDARADASLTPAQAAPEFRLALALPEAPNGLAWPVQASTMPDIAAPEPATPDDAPAAPAAFAPDAVPKPERQADRRAQDLPPRTPPRPADEQRHAAKQDRAAPPSVAAKTAQEARRNAAVKPQTERPAPVRQASLPTASDARAMAPPPGLDIAAFRAAVAQRVGAMKRYPPGARERGEEGRPVVAFVIDGGGRLVSVNIATRSGHAELDAETLSMVRRAAPFPAPPPGAPRAFSLGVSFRLD